MASFHVEALSADGDFLAKLQANNFIASIHSQFNQVINLHCQQDNQLYTLASTVVDNAPHTLRMILPTTYNSFHQLALDNQLAVRANQQCLQLGSKLIIHFSSCLAWSPPLISYIYQPGYLLAVSEEIVNKIVTTQNSSLFYYHGDNIFHQSLHHLLISNSNDLIDGIKHAKAAKIMNALQGLLGLGIGLTPSGDDYLVGLCSVLAIKQHPGSRYLPLIAQVIRNNAEKTNLISHITLMKAAEGKTRESILLLLAQIFNGKSTALHEQINAVLNIGSSSGADILCGISAGLLLSIYLEKHYADQDFDQKEYLL